MITKQRLPLLTIAMLLLGFVLPVYAAAPPAPAPTKGVKAGSITALLPIARIQRGLGKNLTKTDAKKGDDIIWNDKIVTERGGRARITLSDQSILSLGSQAELTVVKHDARSQQTALALQYGRIRAEVAKVTRQGGSFELRTPTAVAGVIGTDFGSDASTPGVTTFICISGLVQVSNSDPNIAGSVQCAPGLTTTVTAGKAPTPPQNATPEQIQQLIQDTEPAIIAAMSPVSALPGVAIDVTLSGSKLGSVKSVSASGSGLTTTLAGAPSDTAVTVHVVVAADAQPGPRMITLAKSSGAASAAMFTVLSPPTAAQGDAKKAYIELLNQEGQTTRGGLTSYLAAVQQVADQAAQQLQQSNQANININDAVNAFSSQISMLQNAINAAGLQIDEAVTQAGGTFQQQYDAAYQALLQRHPDGTPDDQFNQAVKAIFDSVNGSLGGTFTAIRGNLNTVVSTTNTNIAQVQSTWMSTITASSNPPTPQVNSTERSIDQGAAFGNGGITALDAGNSKATGGASIMSYKWVLCDPSYKPAQFGVPLPGTATAGCNPLSGFQSSSSDFAFATCNLAATDYIARVTVTDSNNVSAAMDVKVHVLAGAYDDPATRVRNLAQAYMTLQPSNFLSFFDETGFSGFTSLSENVRNTFPLLASMQINPRVSQAAITCNDATVRADWVQNYTYKQNANISFNQTEQLSMRMVRQPGKGWYIVDFQGDNGTVQGQLPGPAVTDTAQPDLIVAAVYPTYAGATATNPPVAAGAQSFTANVQNIGSADFTASTVVRFQLTDANNTPIGSPVDVPLPTPLAAGAGVNVQATLNVPAATAGTSLRVSANVNPTCLPEANCDAANSNLKGFTIGAPVNYAITAVSFANHTAPYRGANALQKGESTNIVVTVQNTGTASVTGTITLTGVCKPVNPNDTTSCAGGGNPTLTIAAPAAGQSITVNVPVDFNGMIPGSFLGTVTLTTTIPQSNAVDDVFQVPFDVADFAVIVQSPFTPQYILPGKTQNVTVQVQTIGTTAFAVPLTASANYTGIAISPTNANLNNTTQVFTVTAGPGTAAGGFAALFTGTNHGVSHPITQGFAVIGPQIVSTNLLLNDVNNPLLIAKGSTTPQTVNLKLTGAAFTGSATIVPPLSTLGFTTNVTPTTSVPANGTFDLTVLASSSATNVVTPLVVTAQLPNTNPVLTITYTLFVKSGLPDLQVLSATTTSALSTSQPLIDGQAIDYTVTIKNIGNVASAGNEPVNLTINGLPAGSATVMSSLAPGASQQLNIHAVAPDVHGNGAFSGTGTIKIKVDPDGSGDADYVNNSLSLSVPMANWHFAVSGSGDSQANALFVHTDRLPPYTNPVTFAGVVDGGSINLYSQSLFAPSSGQGSTFLTLGNFAPGAPGSFTADVTLINANAQSGYYFIQTVVQMHDGATVTAQRQATVYVQVSTGFSNTAVPCLTSSANNISSQNAACAAPTNPAAVQINGGLAEQFSVTLSMICGGTAPVACSGTADLAIHDASNTSTSPLGSTNNVPTGTPLLLRVAAVTDGNGNIQAGPASGYVIGVSGSQASAAARGSSISPDPVGAQVPLLFNVGDLGMTANTGANSCTAIASGAPLQLNVQWSVLGGFNSPSLSWQWEDGNHSPVGGGPLSFSNPSGTSTFSGGSYSPSPSLTLTNTQAKDGVQTYFLAVTISNGTSTATKYFPFYFDLSLAQNFCGAVSSARGYNVIHGTWSRSSAGFGGPVASIAAPLTSSGADIHIAASDVSFTPSMPKVGDTVQVRFRASNTGDTDAAGMPIALQINGVTVASDTFDVPKGRTVLGGLTWTATAEAVRGAMSSRPSRPGARGKVVDPDPAAAADDAAQISGTVQLQAALVVDPQHLTKQKTALDKTAAIAHLTLRGTGAAGGGGPVATNAQRILIELEDGACVGLRLSSGGTMPCGTADLEITIGDLAKSLLSLETMAGVGDVGTSFENARRPGRNAVRYSAQAAGISGHSYSVQLPNGNTAVVNVESIRNPAELDAKAQALFRATAARVMRSMGDSSGAQAPGDLTGGGSHATVFIVLNVQGQ